MIDGKIDPLAALLREHARTWRGHCVCGWKRDLMSFTDHADHQAIQVLQYLRQAATG